MRACLVVQIARCACPALLAAACLGGPLPCEAQVYPFSQRGSVAQMVAFTEISVAYGRPVARGRTLFGELVRWDRVWHPGADSATRVAFSHDVRVEGHELKAGEYSLWLIPRASAPWTVILSRAARVYHDPYPGPEADALRLEVPVDTASHMETMANYIPPGAPGAGGDADTLGDTPRRPADRGAVRAAVR